MLLWILGVPLPAAQESASKRSRLVWYSIFALAGAAAIAAYFIGYKRPPSHPPFHFGILQLAHYMILWVGGYFNSAPRFAFRGRDNCFSFVDSCVGERDHAA